MPELKEEEWNCISHNISLISFLQGLPIGGKTYNGYSLVTNSESKEVVLEQNIYILGINSDGKKEYYRIGDKGIEKNLVKINSSEAGRLNLDFTRKHLTNNGKVNYYYSLKDYNASYNSIIMQNDMTTYDDIYKYVDKESNELKEAFYTALGRERWGIYRKSSDNLSKKRILYISCNSNEEIANIVNILKQNQNFDIDYRIYSNNEIRIKSKKDIEDEKENYDLIILDNFVWDYLPDNMEKVSQYTNLITISNDANNSSKIPMIASAETGIDTHNPTVESINATILGQQKIGLEINKSACYDSELAMIKFRTDMNIEVLYNIIYKNNTYDGIGSWKNSAGKRWIHSQIALNYDDTNIIKELVRYALYGY